MFMQLINRYQSKNSANSWKQILQKKQILKNNFRSTGDINKAKLFAKDIASYTPHTHFATHGEHVIFSSELLAIPLEPAYILT
jgi:hypothetical protein